MLFYSYMLLFGASGVEEGEGEFFESVEIPLRLFKNNFIKIIFGIRGTFVILLLILLILWIVSY